MKGKQIKHIIKEALSSLKKQKLNEQGVPIIGNFDDLTRQKRKVIDVYSHEESSSSSLNTLFTIEQTLAQQTYFSYAMGNYGFDLISWYVLKQWLETREKMLSTKRYFKFDDRTQHLLLVPEPKTGERFYGCVSCYVEKPIRDIDKFFEKKA
jgi:hypothetical protein